MSATKVIVGVDGSEHSLRAVQWCAAHATGPGKEVIAVHVIDGPVGIDKYGREIPLLTPEQREKLLDCIAHDWCKALEQAGVSYRVEIMEGSPTVALMRAAETESADFVVTGRRGRGGFAELILGSTSHQLSHHLGRPLVIVP